MYEHRGEIVTKPVHSNVSKKGAQQHSERGKKKRERCPSKNWPAADKEPNPPPAL